MEEVACSIKHNGNDTTWLYADPKGDGTEGYVATTSLALQLKASDRVNIAECLQPHQLWNDVTSHFSGFLVKPNV